MSRPLTPENIDEAGRRWRRKADILMRALVAKSSSRIRSRTPVGVIDPATGRYLPTMSMAAQAKHAVGELSGRARGNWNLAVGAPNRTYDWSKKDPSGQDLTLEHAEILNGWDISERLYLTNALPYIGPLERGSSLQAPQGMVRITRQEIHGLVVQLAAALRAGGEQALGGSVTLIDIGA